MPTSPSPEPVVQRGLIEYTVGTPGVAPPSSARVAVGTTNISNPPAFIQLVGAVSKTSSPLSVGALTAGGGVEVSAIIGLPEFSPISVNQGRELRLVASAGAYHAISGLVLESIRVIGIASSVDGSQVSGFTYPGGTVYNSVSLNVILRLRAVQNTSAGSVVVWVSATLYDAPASP